MQKRIFKYCVFACLFCFSFIGNERARGGTKTVLYDHIVQSQGIQKDWQAKNVLHSGKPTALASIEDKSTDVYFYVGVYLYEYELEAAAKEGGQTYADILNKHLAVLKDHNINAIYLGGVSQSYSRFEEILNAITKYDIKIISQLDFAYFQPAWNHREMESYAKLAGDFISKYNLNPQILAWSIKEEVSLRDVAKLTKYYARILSYAPAAKFNIIHNNLQAAKQLDFTKLRIVGTDRYGFWWESSADGYLSSPEFALNWTHRQTKLFASETLKRKADFMFVFTQGGMLMPAWANKWAKEHDSISYPADKEMRNKQHKKILEFAKTGRMGWKKVTTDKGDFYNVWKYYRTPGNCMRALTWIGVLEGARLVFCWRYTPPLQASANKTLVQLTKEHSAKGAIDYWTLGGRVDESTNPQLDEFGDAAREIRRYGRIITIMDAIDDCPVITKDKYVRLNAFKVPNIKGRVVVAVNLKVGEWPEDSKIFFNERDQIYINDDGTLRDYVAYKSPRTVSMNLSDVSFSPGLQIYDIKTGDSLSVTKEGTFTVSLFPGSGTFLFVGTPEEAATLNRMVTLL